MRGIELELPLTTRLLNHGERNSKLYSSTYSAGYWGNLWLLCIPVISRRPAVCVCTYYVERHCLRPMWKPVDVLSFFPSDTRRLSPTLPLTLTRCISHSFSFSLSESLSLSNSLGLSLSVSLVFSVSSLVAPGPLTLWSLSYSYVGSLTHHSR